MPFQSLHVAFELHTDVRALYPKTKEFYEYTRNLLVATSSVYIREIRQHVAVYATSRTVSKPLVFDFDVWRTAAIVDADSVHTP